MFWEILFHEYTTLALIALVLILIFVIYKVNESRKDYQYRLREETAYSNRLQNEKDAIKASYHNYLTKRLYLEYPLDDPQKIKESVGKILDELRIVESQGLEWTAPLLRYLDAMRDLCIKNIMSCENLEDIKGVEIPHILDFSRGHNNSDYRTKDALASMKKLKIEMLKKREPEGGFKQTGCPVGIEE